ncbi:hypothetical protein B5S50_13595 [Clostridium sp. 001]|nr:hypothetical protein B5S50_13595 [Clostridium sp. 001]
MCICVFMIGIQRRQIKAAELFIIFILAILSFAYQPLSSDDLTREYACLDGIREMGWAFFEQNAHFFESNVVGTVTSSKFNGIYVSQLIYYIFAHLPVYNIFPATVVGFQFYLEFKLLNRLRRHFNLSNRNFVILFITMLFLRELRWMMSGIRNQLAFTIALYVLYEDLMENKNKILSLIGYVLCGMIHQSAYVILILRLILFIPSNKVKITISGIMLFWSNFLNVGMVYLGKFINIPIVNSILWKIAVYTENGDTSTNVVVNPYYMKMIISNIGLLIFSALSIYYFYRFYGKSGHIGITKKAFSIKSGKIRIVRKRINTFEVGEVNSDIITFLLMATCLTIGSNMYYWLYLRFAILIQIWIIVIMAAIAYKMQETGCYKSLYYATGTGTVLLKFTIMMFVANVSFYFNLFGLYPS